MPKKKAPRTCGGRKRASGRDGPLGSVLDTESRKSAHFDSHKPSVRKLMFFMCVFGHRGDLARVRQKLT